MCTLKHLTFKFFESFENLINFKNSFSFTPNLFSIFPVDIFLIVLASVSGFNLIPTFTTFFFIFAILLIKKS